MKASPALAAAIREYDAAWVAWQGWSGTEDVRRRFMAASRQLADEHLGELIAIARKAVA